MSAAGQAPWTAEDWQALYDERAAIMEFDGGLPRKIAEATARGEVSRARRDYPAPPTASLEGAA
ncbi:hypothetical protein SAMN02745157_4839 [Kaistia soli DSM 19436]|uniref:Uncharacterized protein n=1 Tax=Kaistia soli DSM 19436 TaxID=1122133 RepID=A0A1M5MP26_9HYPH|nr:hypothetical protein [Kaistia soli]SHG79058.1 hypothetical protein SAMN02745157_4839 [Kaistia soli DSM 19436]